MRRDEDPFERSKPIHRLFNAGFPSATLRATYSCWHRSDHVRGTDASKGQKGAVVGMGTFPLARRFKPVYISDSQAGTQEKAERIAAQFLARKKKDFFHYECEVVGHQGKGPGGEGARGGNCYQR